MYSQNNEEIIVAAYFSKRIGTFLDIGAYDGVNLSNTYALAKKGWKGVCLEPSPTVFPILESNLQGKDVKCLNYGIGTYTGESSFYDNGNAYATTSLIETKRWNGKEKFKETKIQLKTFKDFYEENPATYDFITIDAEGLDWEILKQIDLNEVGCKMFIVEHNGKEMEKYQKYGESYGFYKVLHNPENLIMAK